MIKNIIIINIRLEDYLQAKEQVFLDQVRSPKKTPTKTDNTPTKTNNTPTKTASKTVRIDTSANRYRLFEKDSNRSISHDHHLTFNYSASKSAESLYRQPILKSNKPSLLTSLPSALPPTSSTTSLPSPKRKQIRLPEQFFKQDESLSRLSRCSNNTNTYTNTNSILTNDDHIDNTVKHSTSYSRYIVIIVLVSALLYTIFVNNNGNTNDTWNSNTNSNAYEIDLYHDTNNRYILDIDTIMTLDMTALIDTYFRKPMYQFINVILEDNSKALVLVKTDSVDHHDSISNYQELIMKPYTIINDIINNSEIISSSYERLYINQMNIITMLTSVVTTMHFFLKR